MAEGEGKMGAGAPGVGGSLGEALGLRCVDWTDRLGVKHALPPLSIRDLVEIETEFGAISTWAEKESISARMWAAVIWRAMRRESLSRAEVKAAKWRVGPEVASELVAIGTGSFKAVDVYGEERTFNALTLRDLVDVEGAFGRFSEWGERSGHPAAFVQRLVWLSLRKEGKALEQIAAGDYSMTEDDAALSFHPAIAGSAPFAGIFNVEKIIEVSDLWNRLLGGSGVKIAPARSNGGEGGAAANPTPEAGAAA